MSSITKPSPPQVASSSNSHQQPHNHPTPQSPPGQFSMSGGASSYVNANSIAAKSSSPTGNLPPIITTTNSIPTPSSSAAGTVPASHDYDLGDQDMMDVSSVSNEGNDGSLKRRRSLDDEGDQPRKSRSASRDLMDVDTQGLRSNQENESLVAPQLKKATVPTIQELLDMPPTGPLFQLCTRRYLPTHPPLTSSLIELYGLKTIANSVARVDPETGQKKKLRKSYKGKIADLSGRIDVTPIAPQLQVREGEEGWGQPVPQEVKGGLLEMMDIPDEEWYNQKVLGKELPRPSDKIGGKQLDFAALKKGLSNWTKAPIPSFDLTFLGLEDPSSITLQKQASPATALNATSPNNTKSAQTPHNNTANNLTTPGSAGSPNGTTAGSPNDQSSRASRKKRRRYDDNSFEGYGEEYEEGDNNGYEDDEDADGKRKKKKKRRKHSDFDEAGTPGSMRMPAPPPPRPIGVGVGVGGDYYGR